MENFPIFINIEQKHVTIFGGGDIALRKAILLIKARPILMVIAKEFSDEFMNFIIKNNVIFIQKSYEPSDISSQTLIIAATDDKKVNKSISKISQINRIPVNVVDQPDLCSFTMGSIVERDALVISISSGGKAPVLARMIRESLEITLPSYYSKLVNFAGSMRGLVQKKN